MRIQNGVNNLAPIFPVVPLIDVSYTETAVISGLYSVLVNQSSTTAPVSTILSNSLAISLVWSRVSMGKYKLSAPTGFTLAKTLVIPTPGTSMTLISTDIASPAPRYAFIKFDTDNNLLIETLDANFDHKDGLLVNFALKIEIFV